MKLKMSFRSKIIVLFLVCTVCCMLIVAGCCRFLLRPLFINNSRKNMLNCADSVEQTIKNDADNLKELLDKIETDYLIHTTVIVPEELGDNEEKNSISSIKTGVSRAKRWIEHYNGETEKATPYFEEEGSSQDESATLIHIRVAENGSYIVMNKSIKGIEQDIELVTIFIIIIGISIAIAGTVSFWILLRPSMNRLEQITTVTEKMSELDFSERLICTDGDEFEILAHSVNKLSEELSLRIDKLKNELEGRKTLIRNLSHELKTPVTTIRGYAENAQIAAKDNEKFMRYCDIIIDECDSVDNLVTSMIELSKLETDGYLCEMEEISTEDFMENIYRKMEQELPDINMESNVEEAKIKGNVVLLQRAIINYIENAVKYGGSGCRIKTSFKVDGDRAVFSVKNDGPLISEEEQDKIWDVFYKQDKARSRDKSYGIGLSFVAQIAEKHRGGVGVSSRDGWTEFILWIPFTDLDK